MSSKNYFELTLFFFLFIWLSYLADLLSLGLVGALGARSYVKSSFSHWEFSTTRNWIQAPGSVYLDPSTLTIHWTIHLSQKNRFWHHWKYIWIEVLWIELSFYFSARCRFMLKMIKSIISLHRQRTLLLSVSRRMLRMASPTTNTKVKVITQDCCRDYASVFSLYKNTITLYFAFCCGYST